MKCNGIREVILNKFPGFHCVPSGLPFLAALYPSYIFILDDSKLAPMEILYFTLAAILLYFAADWILNRVETAAGRRFEYRSLIFFAILLVMALTSFSLIRQLGG